jgi:hypothetical protein
MHGKASNPTDELRRMHKFKSQSQPIAAALGQEMVDFFKQSVAKRQTKLEKLAECWARLVPQILSEHCALESLTRGTLTVMVDSSSHLYELKQLLLSGLEQQLLIACKTAGLRKITLRPGRWYEGDSSSDRKIRFSR